LGRREVNEDNIGPTLTGIRNKLARMNAEIEQIQEKVNKPQDEGGGLQELLEKLEELLKKETIDGGTYRLNYYCEKKEDGSPLDPLEWEIPDAEDQLSAILARLNALAGMVNESHKRRVFVCKGKPVGEPVTITFEET